MNKKNLFLSILLLFLCTTTVFSSSVFTDEELLWIEEHPTLTLSPNPFFKSIEFLNKNGEYDGLSADYIKYIENFTGLEIQIEPSKDLVDILKKIKNKEIDLIGATTPTNDGTEYMLFSTPLISLQSLLITRNNITEELELHSMNNMEIGIIKGDTIESFLNQNYPDINIIYFNSIDDGLRNLSLNTIDAIIINNIQFELHTSNTTFPNLKINNELNFKYNITISVRDDYEVLRDILNKTINNMPFNEKKAILDKWMPKKNYQITKIQLLILKIAISLIGILIISGSLIFFLLRKVKLKTEELEKTNIELKTLNFHLEELVRDRTNHLNNDINTLINTKTELVSAEETILLNNLILTLSDEINEPITNINTIIKFLQISNVNFQTELENSSITRNSLIKHQLLIEENLTLLISLINKTDNINKTFETFQIQSSQEKSTEFEFYTLLNKINKNYSFKYKHRKFNFDITTNFESLNVNLPKKQIEFIISEFIDNAVIHGYKENEFLNISASFTNTGSNLIIIFKDFGSGINEEFLDKIFDPFFTTSRNNGSIGLGLFIIYTIVHSRLNGKILTINSAKGVTFKVIIPLD